MKLKHQTDSSVQNQARGKPAACRDLEPKRSKFDKLKNKSRGKASTSNLGGSSVSNKCHPVWLHSLLPSWASFEISSVASYLSLHQNVNGVSFSSHPQGNSCFTPLQRQGWELHSQPWASAQPAPSLLRRSASRVTLGKRQDHSPPSSLQQNSKDFINL